MATTVATLVRETRALMRDVHESDYVVPPTLLEEVLDANYLLVTANGYPSTVSPTWLSVTAGTGDYLVSTEYHSISNLVLTSDNSPLSKVSREMILELRSGSGSPSQGDPVCYSFDDVIDSNAVKRRVSFYPVPAENDTVSAWLRQIPDRLAGLLTTNTNTNINLTRMHTTALKLLTASGCLAMLPPESLGKLMQTPEGVAKMESQGQLLLQAELERLAVTRRVGYVQHARGW